MRMKSVLLLMLILMTAALPVWSNGQSDEASENSDAANLKIFVPNSPGLVDGMDAVLKSYAEQNPGLSYELRSVPFKKYKDALQVMWSSSDVDDIISTGAPDIANYASYGALQPLDDILPEAEHGLFLDSVIDAVSYEGSIYAYPFREAASAMYYNKDMFAAAGLTAPEIDDPWTWPEFLENMKKIQAVQEKEEGKQVWGLTFLSNPGRGDFWITPIIRSAGDEGSNTFKAISDDGLSLKGYADTPEAMKAYAFYQSLYTEHKICSQAEIPDAFGNGQAATLMSFMSTAKQLNKKFPDLNWGLMPNPYFKTPITHTGGFTLALSAKSDNSGAAKGFIRFAGSVEGLKTYIDVSGSDILSRKDFSMQYPEYYAEDYQKFFVEILNKYGYARPLTPGYVLYNSIMGFQLYQDLALGGDVDQTVNAKISELENQLQQFR